MRIGELITKGDKFQCLKKFSQLELNEMYGDQ